MGYHYNPLVNNQFPDIKDRYETINPATGEVIGTVPECASVVDEAVAGAKTAQKEWAQVPLFRRIEKVGEIAALLEKHGQELAELDILDTGSPRHVMEADTKFSVALLRFQMGLAPQVMGKGGDHAHCRTVVDG